MKVLSPSQLNRLARDLLEDSFSQVWVEAEITGFTKAASGHWYFTLKDSRAQIRCAMFRGANQRLSVPANGDRVQAFGKISLFEARGDFQFIIERMQSAGLGDLLQAFEALKARLAAEGLFDAARKRTLPRFPTRIAVISSAQGAAIHDVLNILARRWPLLRVDLYPSVVQGTEGAAELLRAMAAIARRGALYDLVLLTRGGGAREDLLPFDDEAVARAIVAQPQPVVSAVGHEIDFTIADFAADLRAATPSAAAELISPDRDGVLLGLDRQRQRMRRALGTQLRQTAQAVDHNERRLLALAPRSAIRGHRASANALKAAAESQLRLALMAHKSRLGQLQLRVQAHWPAARLRRARERLAQLELRWAVLATRWRQRPAALSNDSLIRLRRLPIKQRLTQIDGSLRRQREILPRTVVRRHGAWTQQLAGLMQSLRNLGPETVLARGYALLLERDSDKPIRSVRALQPGHELRARLADGEVDLRVEP